MMRLSMPRPHLLALALISTFPAYAQQHTQRHQHQDVSKNLDAVQVHASPLAHTAERLTLPVEILAGNALEEAKSGTLGDTIGKLPGVQNASFGPGVGRPIIRGLDGARIQILSGGLGSGDVSTVSVDHAISIEPFLADQIEVLKGPATLLYGSGAIGGAVNVIDGRIPETLPQAPLTGRMEARGASGNHERTGMLRLDGALERFTFHFDALHRNTGDMAIPGWPESTNHLLEAGETPDPAEAGTLPNSAIRTTSASLGISHIGERSLIGAGYSLYSSTYGIPGHTHAHDEDHDDDHDHLHDDAEDADAPVRLQMDQRRNELRAGLDNVGVFSSLRMKLAETRYRHTEFEGAHIGTVFNNRSRELRNELVHQPLAGWEGALGMQLSTRDFSAVGAEAFVPSSSGKDQSLFWLGRRDVGIANFDVGLRHDRLRIETDASTRTFHMTSASLGSRWKLSPALDLNIGLDHAQRAPNAEELYSNGLHVATGSFEYGMATLRKETANRFEAGLHVHQDRWEASLSGWRVNYADFIYLASSNQEMHGAPLRVWQQGHARFHGMEAKLDWELVENTSGLWTLGMFADLVHARLTADADSTRLIHVTANHGDHQHAIEATVANGGNLPRIAPARVGLSLRWEYAGWRASVGAVHSAKQERTARFEQATAGYTLLDAHLTWHKDLASGNAMELFIDGNNLSNREARPHTSLLKDTVPLAGRSISAGVRLFF